MTELPLSAVIGWLVHERFGGYDAETKVHGHMQRIPPEAAADAETYKGLLKRRPEDQVRQMFNDRMRELRPEASAAIEDRESILFFNRPSAVANYGYWSRAPIWSLEESVALAMGREPEVVNWGAFESESATATPFAATYLRIVELVHRSIQAGLLSEPIEPKLFLEWCSKVNLAVPPPLLAGVEAVRGRLIDWQQAYLRVSSMYKEAQDNIQAWADAFAEEQAAHAETRRQFEELDEFASGTLDQLEAERAEHAAELEALKTELIAAPRDLKTRERESLLKIIIGMAVAGYSYDPAARRSDRVTEIVDDLQRLGIPVSDETVRKFLRMAVEVLPPEAKITAA